MPLPQDYATRRCERVGQPVDPHARTKATALVQKMLRKDRQPQTKEIVLFQKIEKPTPLVPGGEPQTPEEEVFARAQRLLDEGKCSSMDTAIQTVFATDTDLYWRYTHRFRETSETRRANIASEEALAAMEAVQKQVQGEHPDWNTLQVTDEVIKRHPELYKAYRDNRIAVEQSSTHRN